MALGNEPSAAADVAAVLEIEPSSPDALKLQGELDQGRMVRAKAAVQAQKKAFGSFWGSSKGATEGVGGDAPHSKHPAAELYGDKVREARGMSGQVFCWMRLAVGGRALGQRVVLELHPKWGPKTVENFRCLCTGEKTGPAGEPLTYAGSGIHRVCRGFVLQVPAATPTHRPERMRAGLAAADLSAAQGGDIVHKSGHGVGQGLASIYGGGFENEKPVGGARPGRHLSPGLVGMANDGRPKSAGCQVS